jgi:single-stranded-DNA-specific exonuclease
VNPGLKALLEMAQIPATRPPTSGEIAFRIAPRLNAAGRMDVARDVIDLFSVKDPVRAREIAARLDQLNAERQEEERRILQAIDDRFEQEPDLRNAHCVVIDGDGWHRGVIGITATRVVEQYGRPTLVLSHNNGEAHGSGRSIRAFHLLDALESCRELFTRYGGHSHAVGFSLPSVRVPELRARLDEYARIRLVPADFEPVLDIDAELDLEQVTPDLFRALDCLEPFGQGNPEPVFSAKAVRMMAPPKILKDKHVKLKLAAGVAHEKVEELSPVALAATPRCDPDAATIRSEDRRSGEKSNWRRNIAFDALGWHMAERLQATKLLAGDTLDIAFCVGHNDHPEYGGLELALRDFRVEGKS